MADLKLVRTPRDPERPPACMADLVGDDLYDLAVDRDPKWIERLDEAGRLPPGPAGLVATYRSACRDLMRQRALLHRLLTLEDHDAL